MKLKVLKEYLNECLETINRIKGTDLKIVQQDLCSTSNNKINAVDFTLVFEGSLFIKLHLSLWVNIRDEDKTEYQKALIGNIWDQVRKLRREILLEQSQQAILKLNGVGFSKITLNGLADYSIPTATPRNEPVYIDHDSAYLDTGVIYNKADVDMTLDLDGKLQQVLKQHKDDLVNQRLKQYPDFKNTSWQEVGFDIEE